MCFIAMLSSGSGEHLCVWPVHLQPRQPRQLVIGHCPHFLPSGAGPASQPFDEGLRQVEGRSVPPLLHCPGEV